VRPVPIGVAVVNWNGRDDTLACLKSLLAADPRPARVVVVDNASGDGSAAAISDWIRSHGASGFDLLAASSNVGFAAACNLALDRLGTVADLNHFFLLNNDATVDPGCFAEIDAALSGAPSPGILGVTILEAGSRRPWYAGGRMARWRAFGRNLRKVPRDGRPLVPTEFVSGCAMLISRTAWVALGRLPECYFMYFEDAEYCLRAAAAGLAVAYAPGAVVNHRVAGTVERGAVAWALGEYRFARSRALFARRNLRGAVRWSALAYLVVVGFAKAALRTLRGRPARAWTAYRGTWAGLLAVEGQGQAGRAAGQGPDQGGVPHQ
jgi:GT2 family glycosyltransferase